MKVKAQPVRPAHFARGLHQADSLPSRQTIVVPSKAVGSLLKPVVDLLTSAVPGGITLRARLILSHSLPSLTRYCTKIGRASCRERVS